MCPSENSFVSLTRRLTQQVHRTIVNPSPDGRTRAPHSTALATLPRAAAPRALEASVLAIDVSGSMEEPYAGASNKLAAAQAAAITYIVTKASSATGDLIGLLSFDEHAQAIVECGPISHSRKELIRAVQSLTIGGGTDIEAPLLAAGEMLSRTPSSHTPRHVLITDGHGGTPMEAATELQRSGVIIDVIGIGDTPDRVNESLLRRVASVVDGQSRYVFIRDLRSLIQHTNSISRQVNRTGASA